jgi:twitching motility protein PilT
VAAYEVLLATPAVANLVREGKVFQIPSIMQTARGRGMMLLDESLLTLVREGQVTPEDAYRKANEKNEFLNRLRAADIEVAGEEERLEEPPRLRQVR